MMGLGCVLAGGAFPVTSYAAGSDTYAAEESFARDDADVDILNADAKVIDSGTTTGGCKWNINDKYELKISGAKGAVLYGTDKDNWWKYKDDITSIVIDVPAAKDLKEIFLGFGTVKTIKATIPKVEGNMSLAFACHHAVNFDDSCLVKADLSGMNISKVTSIHNLFYGCDELSDLNIKNWDTSNVTNMEGVFGYCRSLKKIDVSNWNTSKVTNMYCMFQNCYQLEELDISKWDTSNVRNAGFLFSSCMNVKKLDVSKWNTSKMINMENMFQSCKSLTAVNLSNFNTKNVKNMNGMFFLCSSLKKLDVSTFDTRNVTDMSRMFGKCSGLTSLNLGKFNTAKVTDMNRMFWEDTNLTNLNLSSFDTSKVQNIYWMFYNCQKIKNLNLGSFQLDEVVNPDKAKEVFIGCESLEILQAPKHLKVDISLGSARKDGRVWYRDDTNTQITKLPKKMNASIPLHMQEKGNKIVDVRTTGWEYEAVKYVTSKSLMNGVGATDDKNKYIIFKGNDFLTRAQFVQVLFNREGPKVDPKQTNPFKDVKKTDYFYNAVLWANKNEMVSGTSSKTFSPNDKIRRQDLVTILYKYAASKNKKYITITKNYTINSFKDHASVDKYAVKAMTWATCHKIVSGKPITGTKNYNLDPKGTASRAECAAILKNFETYVNSVDKSGK